MFSVIEESTQNPKRTCILFRCNISLNSKSIQKSYHFVCFLLCQSIHFVSSVKPQTNEQYVMKTGLNPQGLVQPQILQARCLSQSNTPCSKCLLLSSHVLQAYKTHGRKSQFKLNRTFGPYLEFVTQPEYSATTLMKCVPIPTNICTLTSVQRTFIQLFILLDNKWIIFRFMS